MSNKKVAVGLSGGVDSAVTAHLLIKQGYEVTAFFMKNWDREQNSEINNLLTEKEICSVEKDYEDAKKIANHLGIKLIRVNFIKEYWNNVFSKFLKDIENGKTPNPDILCNRHVKFGVFTDYIFENYPWIDQVAMGHYANVKKIKDKWYLTTAKDKLKDQTYFLAGIKKDVLSKLIFPLADLQKTEIREIANNINLPNANKKDSTGICFIGKRNFPEFISNYLENKPGDILKKETGEIVGKHRGVLFYTIGQRRGLDLGGQEQPHYVSGKDIKNNVIYVSAGDEKDILFTNNIKAKQFNDLSNDITKIEGDIIIKTRHSEISYPGRIVYTDGLNIEVESYQPIKFVTPGQELVLYQGEICLGGGEIFNEL